MIERSLLVGIRSVPQASRLAFNVPLDLVVVEDSLSNGQLDRRRKVLVTSGAVDAANLLLAQVLSFPR